MPVTTHCWPSGSANPPTTMQPAGMNFGNGVAATGTLKGVMVWLHGLTAATTASVQPIPLVDVGGILPMRGLTLANTIAATGWRVINPIQPGDGYVGGNQQIIYNDIGADAGHGSRVVNAWMEWWDHIVWYVQKNISSTVPIVPVGMSWGAYLSMLIAIHRTSTIGGYVANHPVSIVSDLNPIYSNPLTFSNITTTGADIASSGLNGVTSIPGLLCWGSIDSAIGPSPWTGDTLTPAIYTAASGAGAAVTPNCDGTGTTSNGSPQENHVLTSSTDNANPNNDVNRIAAWFTAHLPHN